MAKQPAFKEAVVPSYTDLIEMLQAFDASSIYEAAQEAEVRWKDYLFYGRGVRDDAHDCLVAVEEVCKIYNFNLTALAKMLVVANKQGIMTLLNPNWEKYLPEKFHSVKSKSFIEEDGA